jgi:hypothetical protein
VGNDTLIALYGSRRARASLKASFFVSQVCKVRLPGSATAFSRLNMATALHRLFFHVPSLTLAPKTLKRGFSITSSQARLLGTSWRTCTSTPRPTVGISALRNVQTAAHRLCHSGARAYSTSSAESAETTFPDPDRPDLFYHLVESPLPSSGSSAAFALSFLPDHLPKTDSCAVIGWLPAAAESEAQEAGLNDFVENRESELFCVSSFQ